MDTLTNEYEWDLHSEAFALQEDSYGELQEFQAYNQHDQHIYNVNSGTRPNIIYNTIYEDISPAFDDTQFISATSTSNRGLNTTAEDKSRKWSVGLDITKKTIKDYPEGRSTDIISHRVMLSYQAGPALLSPALRATRTFLH